MALIDSNLTLHQRGWSQRRIARGLGINRKTVGRYRQNRPPTSNPANAPIGSERIGRPSDCEPYRVSIVAWLVQGLTAQRIFQDLVREHGFASSYCSVRRFVGRLQQTTGLPVRRMEVGPGEEVQVDFGTAAPIVSADGKRRRPHVYRVVLSHSRKGYSEVVPRQPTEAFMRCLENAFWEFGGAPQRVVLDNLRAPVPRADWFDRHRRRHTAGNAPRSTNHKGGSCSLARRRDYSHRLRQRLPFPLAERAAVR
jgi:transposase